MKVVLDELVFYRRLGYLDLRKTETTRRNSFTAILAKLGLEQSARYLEAAVVVAAPDASSVVLGALALSKDLYRAQPGTKGSP